MKKDLSFSMALTFIISLFISCMSITYFCNDISQHALWWVNGIMVFLLTASLLFGYSSLRYFHVKDDDKQENDISNE